VAPKLDGIAKKRDPVLDEAWRRAEGEIASGLTEIRESYSAKEIAAGAKPRVWPQLKLPDTNVTAQLTTTWSNLAIDYKLTLSGKRAALESFLEDHPRMRVRFAQPDGVTTMQFPISAKEFHLAAKTGNANGTSQAVAVGNAQSGLLRYFHAERWYIVWLD